MNLSSSVDRMNWWRLVCSGLAAGLIVNLFEYGGHRIYLDGAWTAAFGALGKTPAGWSTYIPANFLIGILLVWLYARLRPTYGSGPKTALLSGLAIWVVFWAIPLMAIVPMNLFPVSLLAAAIALGVVDVSLAVLLGVWLFQEPPHGQNVPSTSI
jgi:hypothetical protein